MEAQRSKDTYVKKRKVGIETMLRPKPRMAMSSLNLTDSESRIIALDLISADEARDDGSYQRMLDFHTSMNGSAQLLVRNLKSGNWPWLSEYFVKTWP